MSETKCPICGGQKVMFRAITPQVDETVEAAVRCLDCQGKFIAVLGFVEYVDEMKKPMQHLGPKPERDLRDL